MTTSGALLIPAKTLKKISSEMVNYLGQWRT